MTTILPESDHPSLQEMLAEAAERSGKYEWMAAAELYQLALEGLDPGHDPLETARVTGLLAKSYFKGAFQAETREAFKRRMLLAEASYQKVAGLYQNAGSEAPSKMSRARALFASFWLKEEPEERRGIIERCNTLGAEAARLLERQADRRKQAEANNDLLAYMVEAQHFVREGQQLKEIFDKVLETGERAVGEFESLGEDEGLLESLNKTLSFLASNINSIGEQTRYRELERRAEILGRQLVETSKRAGTPYALSLANQAVGWAAFEVEGDPAKALTLFEAGAKAAEPTKDSLLIGSLHALAVYSAGWTESS